MTAKNQLDLRIRELELTLQSDITVFKKELVVFSSNLNPLNLISALCKQGLSSTDTNNTVFKDVLIIGVDYLLKRYLPTPKPTGWQNILSSFLEYSLYKFQKNNPDDETHTNPTPSPA